LKYLKVILSTLLCVTLFSGCDKIKLKQFNNPALPQVTLNFCWIGAESPSTKAVLKEVSEKSKLNIQLSFTWLYNYTIENSLDAASPPIDAFIIGGKDNTSDISYSTLAKKGELLDLTDLFPTNAPDIYKNLTKADIDALKVDG